MSAGRPGESSTPSEMSTSPSLTPDSSISSIDISGFVVVRG
jgi:hypothetical protein